VADDGPSARQGIAGQLALACAVVGLGGFSLSPWLAYIPAVIALALFTLVIWLGVCDSLARTSVLVRAAATLVLGFTSSALFWVGAPPSFAIPALWSSLAAISTRTAAWATTACLAVAYGIWLMV
jgi:hypothetical protein